MQQAHWEQLRTLKSAEWAGEFPTAMLALAQGYARQFQSIDPESDANAAVLWLWEQLPAHLEKFVSPLGRDNAESVEDCRIDASKLGDSSLDVNGLLRWSRTVLRNKVLEQRRRDTREAKIVTGVLDLEALAAPPAPPQEHGLEQNPELRLIARERQYKLLLLLTQELDRADLLLGRLASFSVPQLAQCLPYTRASVPVLTCRWRAELLERLSQTPQPVGRLATGGTEDDLPLSTARTPRLRAALCDLEGIEGTRLLTVLMELPPPARRRYLARLAGFWDSVVAAVWQEPVTQHRGILATLRQELETRLHSERSALPPAPPSYRSSLQPGESTPMSHQTDSASMRAALLREGTAQDEGPSTVDPATVLQDLLRDPLVQESLRLGRQRWQRAAREERSGRSILAQSAQTLESLWRELQSLGDNVSAWLEPMVLVLSPLPVRSGEPQPPPPTFLQPTEVLLGGESGTLLVWRVTSDRLELLRVREVTTAARAWSPLRIRDEGQAGPTTLLLVRLPEGHSLNTPLSAMRDSALLPEGEVETLLTAVSEAAFRGEVAVQWLEIG